MKIAFPTQENKGVDSAVYGHFGTARSFVIVDTDKRETTVVDNRDLNHEHGKCQPMAALGGQNVDAVVVGGIGGGALRKLNGSGVTVYRAVEGTVARNLALVQDAKLPQFTMNQTCAGHQGIDGCAH